MRQKYLGKNIANVLTDDIEIKMHPYFNCRFSLTIMNNVFAFNYA